MSTYRLVAGCAIAAVCATAAANATQLITSIETHVIALNTGKVTLARLRWRNDFSGSRRGGFSAAWNHD